VQTQRPQSRYLDVAELFVRPGAEPSLGATRIHIEGNTISRLEPLNHAPNGRLALPAFTNAHDHGRGLKTLSFGALDDALESWLPTLAREPKVDPYLRAAVAFARMAEGGVAATNHTHGFQIEARARAEVEAVARAANDVGIRIAFAAPFRDRNPLAYGDQDTLLAAANPAFRAAFAAGRRQPAPVRDYLAFVDEIASFEGPFFNVQYCPVGVQWASDASLAAIAEASAMTGRRVHMHLLETRYQREWADHAYGGHVIRRLDDLGLLSPRLSVAHGVYLRPDECALLAERGVIVSVNTSSNLRLRSGIAPVKSFIEAGLRFGIGLDASPLDDDDDILREMRLVWLHHRGWGLTDVLTRSRLFEAATHDGRRAVLGDQAGAELLPGAPADLMLLDYAAMSRDILSATQEPIDVILTRATRKHIARLVVAGRDVVVDGTCVSVDRPALEADLLTQARAAWTETPPDDAATVEMRRTIRRYYGCGCHMDGLLAD
jgi:cytosine/adenosine deaminase-related metal-dependent hydrolase